MTFIAAMDNSGGSAGGVLDQYQQDYTEEDKMDHVHNMRMRMIASPNFNNDSIWAAIVYKDSVPRGIVQALNKKGIESYLKIDNGCTESGLMNDIYISDAIEYATSNGCTGTKMRSIIKSEDMIDKVLAQQFMFATDVDRHGLMPIVEPEIPINHPEKAYLEVLLRNALHERLTKYKGTCILKLTLPDVSNLYYELTKEPNVNKVVGLSGGYSTNEACNRLELQDNMSASFSRALSEGLLYNQSEYQFNTQINENIRKIKKASE